MNNRKKRQIGSVIKGQQRGAVAIMVALLLGVLLGVAALAVDVGYLMTAKNELQNVADSAALAGVSALRGRYWTYSSEQKPDILTVIQDIAANNQVAGENITIADSDVTISSWPPPVEQDHPNAVEVTAVSNPIPTFFARVIGEPILFTAKATAALVRCELSAGKLCLPIGVYQKVLDAPDFYDGTRATIGGNFNTEDFALHTYDDNTSVDTFLDNLDNIMKYVNGNSESSGSPAIKGDQTVFNLVSDRALIQDPNGAIEIVEKMEALFNDAKDKNDGIIDCDDDSGTWTTTVVVYGYPSEDQKDLEGRQTKATIVGFCTVTIKNVNIQMHGAEIQMGGTISRLVNLPALVE